MAEVLADSIEKDANINLNLVEPGDLFLVHNNHYFAYSVTEALTESCTLPNVGEKKFGHAGVIVQKFKGTGLEGKVSTKDIMVVEAGLDGVEYRTLSEALMTSPTWPSSNQRSATKRWKWTTRCAVSAVARTRPKGARSAHCSIPWGIMSKPRTRRAMSRELSFARN